jgi:hypothetical protein
MLPSLTDYLHGMRRLWWIPLLTTLVGLGVGLFVASGARPTTEASISMLFAFRTADTDSDSADAAGTAEEQVAQSRLRAYVEVARTSPQVQEILAANGIEEPPTTASTSGTFNDPSVPVLLDTRQDETGVVEVRVRTQDLSPAEADALVAALSGEVGRQVLAIDDRQVNPSLLPDPLVTESQSVEVPATRTMTLTLPVLLLAMLGLGLVYLIVWRQDLIYAQRDIEDRVGARVVGDMAGRPADAHAIVLALAKGRETGTHALIVPVGGGPAAAAELGESLAAAGRELGLDVSLSSAEASIPQHLRVAAPGEPEGAARASGVDLALVEANGGLDANALMAAGSANIVALAVTYGKTSYGDLNAAGKTLAEITDADIVVVGVHS